MATPTTTIPDDPSSFSIPQTSTDSLISSSTSSGGAGGWTGRGNANAGDTNAPLYLYTFIAVLCLLLVASAAVIIRTRLNRQRQRQATIEAIRNGTFVRHHHHHQHHRRERGRRETKINVEVGPKPVFWEASLGGGYLDPRLPENRGDKCDEKDLELGLGQQPQEYPGQKFRWKELMPVSTQPLVSDANSQGAGLPSRNPLNRLWTFLPRVVPSARPRSPGQTELTSRHESDTSNHMRVSFLIAMPSPDPVIPIPKVDGSDEEWGLPHLELGSIDVVVAKDSERLPSHTEN